MTAVEERSLALTPTEKQHAPDVDSFSDLTAMVLTWSPLLFRVAHAILRNRPEAEDVVQDTFVRVLQHQAELPHLADPKVWLTRIAWNLALDHRRRIRPDQLDTLFADRLAATLEPADSALVHAQRIAAVLLEIERLPAPERHALLLSAVDELRTPEIAAILNRSESAVRALLARARARLRERLAAPRPRKNLFRKEKP